MPGEVFSLKLDQFDTLDEESFIFEEIFLEVYSLKEMEELKSKDQRNQIEGNEPDFSAFKDTEQGKEFDQFRGIDPKEGIMFGKSQIQTDRSRVATRYLNESSRK